jgi:hypothetical protein
VLKLLSATSEEVRIASFLSSPKMRSDPRNHTVPVIDIIDIPHGDRVLLVMPYLRVFDTPPFHCKGEIIDALRQFLQVYSRFLPWKSESELTFLSYRALSSCMSTGWPIGE